MKTKIAVAALAIPLALGTVYYKRHAGGGHGGGGSGTTGACFGYSSAIVQQVPGVLALDPTKYCWTTTNGLPAWDSTSGVSSAVIPQVSQFVPYTTQTSLLAIMEAQVTGSLANATSMSFTARLTNTGTPIFNYAFEPSNTCVMDAHARAWFDDGGGGTTDRWWSNPVAFDLQTAASGADYVFTTPLDPSQWSDVNGIFGKDVLPGFQAAENSVRYVGVVLGGGCFFGHGVNVSGGTSTLRLLDFRVQ